MSLSYDKITAKDKGMDSVWTSYCDLFTMLSVIFLMLYVIASLRSGTEGIKQKIENKKLTQEAEDLREQNRVYNTLKDDALDKSGADEQKVYSQLMDKLSLLQEEADKEKVALRKKAGENEQKEVALNKYQQIVRNIINANMLAKAGLKNRDEVIETKKETIREKSAMLVEKSEQIDQLNADVQTKEQQVAQNTAQIAAQKQALAQKIAELQSAQAESQSSKEDMEAQVAQLQAESDQKVGKLAAANDNVTKQLALAKDQLNQAASSLDKRTKERNDLIGALTDTKNKYEGQIASLQGKFDADMAGKKAAFDEALAAQKLSGEERAAKEKEFADAAGAEAEKLKGQLDGLAGKAKDAEAKLAKAGEAQKKYQQYIAGLEKNNADLNDDLAKSKNIIRAKKDLADKIAKSFEHAGIKAEVDEKTGDVTLAFGKDYFDTGRADLKPGMEARLKKFMPSYADTLFKDKKIANSIASVEIVGFASPTYKGKLVDPESLDVNDQAAVNYNMDLSYNRAKSIFNYVFDTRKMRYKYQKNLLPMVKVTGRSYLSEDVKGRDVTNGLTQEDYCKQYDCKTAQKVTIRFNLKD